MLKAQYFCIIIEPTSTFHLLGARLQLFLMQARHTSWPLAWLDSLSAPLIHANNLLAAPCLAIAVCTAAPRSASQLHLLSSPI